MSKVTMPSPAHRGPAATGSYFDSYSKRQMQDYANERVREALEAAAKEIEHRRHLLMEQNVVLDISAGVAVYEICANAVRALIPKQ